MDEELNDSIFNTFFFEKNFEFNNSRDPRISNIEAINPNGLHCDDANLFTLHGSDNIIEQTMKDGLNNEKLLDSELSSKNQQTSRTQKIKYQKNDIENSGSLKKKINKHLYENIYISIF